MYAGNEGDIFSFWNNTGFILDVAKDLKPGPLILYPEHRYYGESLPFGDKTFRKENMYGLTVSQAMEDFIAILQDVKAQYYPTGAGRSHPPHPRVLAFGGSYGGMLSAWLRVRYPHVIYAAYAASAPVHTDLKTDEEQFGFFDVVLNDFSGALPDELCTKQLGLAFTALRSKGATDAGRLEVSKSLGLCDVLKSPEDVRQTQFWIVQAMVAMSMLDYPEASNFMSDMPAWPVATSCNAILSRYEKDSSDLLGQLGAFMNVAYNSTGRLSCFDVKSNAQCADRSGCGDPSDPPAWAYQACTELSMNIRVRPGNGVIPTDVLFSDEEIKADCMKRFGVIPDPDAISRQFGQFCPCSDVGSRILWTNGDLDPWGSGGVSPDSPRVADQNVALLVQDGAHHLELREPKPKTDPPGVVTVRSQIRKVVSMWLQGSTDQEMEELISSQHSAAEHMCQPRGRGRRPPHYSHSHNNHHDQAQPRRPWTSWLSSISKKDKKAGDFEKETKQGTTKIQFGPKDTDVMYM